MYNKKRIFGIKKATISFVSILGLSVILCACASSTDTTPGTPKESASEEASVNNTQDDERHASKEPISGTDMFFDTVVTITLYGEDKQNYIDECFDLARYYENLFSNTIPESDISRINEAKGDYVQVSPETIDLLNAGLEYGKISGGQFNISVGKLSDLWHFSENDGDVPADEEIQSALQTIEPVPVSIADNTVALTNPDSKLDLGGIAKGYIADRMRDYLIEAGINSGIINLGGNVVVIGSKPDGSKYKIGIQKPFSDQNDVIAYVESDEVSVVTSGVYERYFYVDDTLYHHILNLATGYPANNGLSSVTIISRNSVDGDGLSTTCFLLGLEKGMELIENTPEIEAVFITEDNEIHTTSSVGDQLVLVQ